MICGGHGPNCHRGAVGDPRNPCEGRDLGGRHHGVVDDPQMICGGHGPDGRHRGAVGDPQMIYGHPMFYSGAWGAGCHSWCVQF